MKCIAYAAAVGALALACADPAGEPDSGDAGSRNSITFAILDTLRHPLSSTTFDLPDSEAIDLGPFLVRLDLPDTTAYQRWGVGSGDTNLYFSLGREYWVWPFVQAEIGVMGDSMVVDSLYLLYLGGQTLAPGSVLPIWYLNRDGDTCRMDMALDSIPAVVLPEEQVKHYSTEVPPEAWGLKVSIETDRSHLVFVRSSPRGFDLRSTCYALHQTQGGSDTTAVSLAFDYFLTPALR